MQKEKMRFYSMDKAVDLFEMLEDPSGEISEEMFWQFDLRIAG